MLDTVTHMVQQLAVVRFRNNFHAHHALWKACRRLGDADRAEVELQSARHYVRSVDELTPEAIEIRNLPLR